MVQALDEYTVSPHPIYKSIVLCHKRVVKTLKLSQRLIVNLDKFSQLFAMQKCISCGV